MQTLQDTELEVNQIYFRFNSLVRPKPQREPQEHLFVSLKKARQPIFSATCRNQDFLKMLEKDGKHACQTGIHPHNTMKDEKFSTFLTHLRDNQDVESCLSRITVSHRKLKQQLSAPQNQGIEKLSSLGFRTTKNRESLDPLVGTLSKDKEATLGPRALYWL
jgi:hypothetical protein